MKNIINSVALVLASLCSHAALAAVPVITLESPAPLYYAGQPMADADLLPPPAPRRATTVATLDAQYSHLPEPPLASMLLMGVLLIGLSVRQEKDEKFSN